MSKNKNEDKGFFFRWNIENFNFCWHKTGEHLESPAFHIKTSFQTSWRLWLYPRGRDDGEYISYYLFREGGGPMVVNVNFELYLNVVNTLMEPFESVLKVASFKNFQREGVKCFVSRRAMFSPIASQKEKFTLTFCCRIFNVDEDRLNHTKDFALTKIMIERISATEVLDHGAGLQPQRSTYMEVKSLLENDPLISINVSCLEESLVIKILPKSCAKIKYAICKITIIKKWTNESPIEYVQSWIGKIKTDIIRYHAPYQKTKSVKLGFESNPPKTFILHYDFAFSAGGEFVEMHLVNHCLSDTDLQCARTANALGCFDVNLKSTNYIQTALDTLKYVYISGAFVDENLEAGSATFRFHKALLYARSPIFKSMCAMEGTDIDLSYIQDGILGEFLLFLYTDTIPDLCLESVIHLFHLSSVFEVEMLRIKCIEYLTDFMDVETVNFLLMFAHKSKDSSVKAVAQSYIKKFDDLVFNSKTWRKLSKDNKQLAKETILSIYKKKKDERSLSYTINTNLA